MILYGVRRPSVQQLVAAVSAAYSLNARGDDTRNRLRYNYSSPSRSRQALGKNMGKNTELLTLEEASRFASKLLGREVTQSNVSYLIQYGRVRKTNVNGGTTIHARDLENY